MASHPKRTYIFILIIAWNSNIPLLFILSSGMFFLSLMTDDSCNGPPTSKQERNSTNAVFPSSLKVTLSSSWEFVFRATESIVSTNFLRPCTSLSGACRSEDNVCKQQITGHNAITLQQSQCCYKHDTPVIWQFITLWNAVHNSPSPGTSDKARLPEIQGPNSKLKVRDSMLVINFPSPLTIRGPYFNRKMTCDNHSVRDWMSPRVGVQYVTHTHTHTRTHTHTHTLCNTRLNGRLYVLFVSCFILCIVEINKRIWRLTNGRTCLFQ